MSIRTRLNVAFGVVLVLLITVGSPNADNSRNVGEMVAAGARDAQESGDAVLATVSAMSAIAEKISIVEEIAYQTNLCSPLST